MSSLLSSSRNSRSTSNNKKSHRKRSSDTPYNNDVDADMEIAALTTAPTTPITITTTTMQAVVVVPALRIGRSNCYSRVIIMRSPPYGKYKVNTFIR
mmetsp:Transcript_58838/g.63510  ORF Transcript_58838/g.63510 Transcript_58838/m.63510 type:complete len:97 (+) Transcript_58838:34-324(+)